MPKRFLLLLVILLLCSEAIAISAQDAISFATKQNNFLNPGETAEIYPNVRIKDKGRDYWVITVLSSGSLAGFVPVRDKTSPELPDSAIARRELIKTAYVLRYERQLNERSSQQGLWLFDAQNVKFFSDLSQDLKDERIDLTTVKTELEGYPLLQIEADLLIGMLDQLHPLADDASSSLLDATSFENSFFTGPDTNRLNDFEDTFLTSFELIMDLEDKKSQYLASLDSLRQSIALTALPLETKQGLNSLANVPNSLKQFGTKADIAIDLEEQIIGIFNSSQSNVNSLTADLLTREKKNVAFQAMYSRDEDILDKTEHSSLSQLMDTLLADEYFFRWKKQGDLQQANENWGKAVTFYENGSFQQAGQYALRAKQDAINTFEEGLVEQDPLIDTDLIFTGVVLLIVAVIIIYALKNRDKLSGLVSPQEDEVKVYDWEK